MVHVSIETAADNQTKKTNTKRVIDEKMLEKLKQMIYEYESQKK